MLEYIFNKVVKRNRLFKPRVLLCVPSQVTSVERRAVIQAAIEGGAREAYTIEEPMAAAIGAGLPISTPGGNMIVDIGGGTTDIAVISLGGIVASESLRVAGNRMDEVIIRCIKSSYNLMIGDRTAEDIKLRIGSAYPLEPEMTMTVKGRDMVAGLPKTIEVCAGEIREALAEPITQIVEKVKRVLEEDSSGARCRHYGARRRIDRRGCAAARSRQADRGGDGHPRLRRRGPAFLRGPRDRARAGGATGDSGQRHHHGITP